MSLLTWWLKRRAPTESAKKAEDARTATQRAEAEMQAKKEVTALEECMTSKPCAVAGMANCTKSCVHFQPGYVLSGRDMVGPVPPGCRLWRY